MRDARLFLGKSDSGHGRPKTNLTGGAAAAGAGSGSDSSSGDEIFEAMVCIM